VGRAERVGQPGRAGLGLRLYEWRILFKVADGLVLDSFRATPNSDWTGTGVRLNVQRPYGRKPLSLVLGARAEVQAVRTRDPRDPSSATLGLDARAGRAEHGLHRLDGNGCRRQDRAGSSSATSSASL
jgi:hypothetical protein